MNLTKADGTTLLTFSEVELILNGVYGEIHTHDNAVAQSIPTGLTYIKLTSFDSDGLSQEMSPDFANDLITVDHDGNYKISGAFSYKCGIQNTTIYLGIFVNGVEQDQVHWTRKIGTAGDVGSSSCHGIVSANALEDIDVRVRHDNGGSVDITMEYSNLNALMINLE